jgi:hypothetical protein
MGLYSDSITVIAARLPDEPREFSLVESTQSTIFISWLEPYDGGSPVTYYKIYWDGGDGTDLFTVYAFTVDPDTNFIVDDGLIPGNFY